MKLYFLYITFFISSVSFSQIIHHDSFSSNGGVSQLSDGFKVNHSFGQLSIAGNYSSGTFKINQGFQQSKWSRIISEKQLNPRIWTSFYRNPVEDDLNFVFTKKSLEVFNQSGSNQSSNIEIRKKIQHIAGFFLVYFFISLKEPIILFESS